MPKDSTGKNMKGQLAAMMALMASGMTVKPDGDYRFHGKGYGADMTHGTLTERQRKSRKKKNRASSNSRKKNRRK